MKDSKKSPFKEIMTSNDVMDLLCVSRSTVHRMSKKGKLPSYKLSGRIYFKRDEIMKSLEAGKIESACSTSET